MSVIPTPSTKMEPTCQMSGKTIPTTDGLKKHNKRHTEAASFGCTLCDVKLSGASQLKKHYRNHKGETDMAATSVRRTSLKLVTLRFTKKFTLERLLMPATSARRASLRLVILKNTNVFTLEKLPMLATSVRKASLMLVP